MLNKLIKAVAKRDKKVNDVCSQFDNLQAKMMKDLQVSINK